MHRPVEPCSLETCIRTLEDRGFIGIEERYRLLTELSRLRSHDEAWRSVREKYDDRAAYDDDVIEIVAMQIARIEELSQSKEDQCQTQTNRPSSHPRKRTRSPK